MFVIAQTGRSDREWQNYIGVIFVRKMLGIQI